MRYPYFIEDEDILKYIIRKEKKLVNVKKKKDLKEIWINKIETKETALTVIKECVYGFYFVAALGLIASFFLGVAYLVDSIIFVVCAFLLSRFKHVIIAIIMLMLSVLGLITTMINNLTHAKGGSNIFLAIILVWISIRAIQATLKLRKLNRV